MDCPKCKSKEIQEIDAELLTFFKCRKCGYDDSK
ncbi:zf-TFIIB domain-containing protein [Candidatus Woesearchaeota archaeon]|nr:zf-TFIIB domain-containing protein [Candidatus Woesearchaeota archaeon]